MRILPLTLFAKVFSPACVQRNTREYKFLLILFNQIQYITISFIVSPGLRRTHTVDGTLKMCQGHKFYIFTPFPLIGLYLKKAFSDNFYRDFLLYIGPNLRTSDLNYNDHANACCHFISFNFPFELFKTARVSS